jgi:hypothetical protein
LDIIIVSIAMASVQLSNMTESTEVIQQATSDYTKVLPFSGDFSDLRVGIKKGDRPEAVVRFRCKNDDKNDGENDEYRITFSLKESCCESFGLCLYLNKGGAKYTQIKKIEEIDSNITKFEHIYNKAHDSITGEHDEDYNEFLAKFHLENGGDFTIQFYNCHNGHYSHSFKIWKNKNLYLSSSL